MVKSGFQEEEQLWFLGVLDRKFQEQETAIRDLLLSIARPDVGQPFRERRTDLSVTAPMASDNMQSPRSSLARVREVRVTALSDTSDAYEGMKSEATPPAASPSNASASGTPNGKRSKALARAMNDDLTDKDPPAKAFIKHSLDAYMGLVVVINLGLMITMAQLSGDRADYELQLSASLPAIPDSVFEVADNLFFIIYILDVLARIIVLRKEWYYDPIEGVMFMNIFDALLVMVHAFELIILPSLFIGGDSESASSIRVLKLIRIVRTLRIVKTVNMFRQLRLLVGTCVASMGALFWSMVLLCLLKLGFALVICQALQGFIMDDSHDMATRLEMNNLYGNFLKAFYTLFEITHSGSWPSKVRPVIEKVNPWYAVLFCSYIAFVVFAVIRIVTALFLQETLSNAANDADMLLENSRRLAKDYQDKLEELFQAADNDGDGSLTPDEFVDALSIPGVQRYLTMLDVRVQDCRPLFDILDDGDGQITIAEFCKGLMQLKGQARALDIVMLTRENAKMMKICQEIHTALMPTGKVL
ncbi:Sodium channel protein type 11 subunit alpha [Symbiodinium microadriaticum]|uniref:Sodium channel protein type 11 subunit alpha n=1 Tax=Symbiodinium microadriaticum TaxID=2951 RepID=A0A1Q9E637_SYMMI|nr:Sodium channel protein type 11 subunit alpha [Symbiodinium microadriaticum]CAE7896908.1 Scn11a [Symbiodinium microadriaticum]